MTPQFEFDELQTNCRVTESMADGLRRELNAKHQQYQFAPKTQQKRLEKLDKAAYKAREKILDWLAKNSPRDWCKGIPFWWSYRKLTYEDAITSGQLSVTPEPAYGYSQLDSQWFAGPITK